MSVSVRMWSVVCVAWAVAVAGVGAEVMPTRVVGQPLRTQPPEDVSRPQFAQTLYKATDYYTQMNTLIPLWASHSVEYHATHTTTVMNQTIPTSTVEFATVLNTTVEYYTDLLATNTLEVAATTYQTMEFQHQTVLYTDRANQSHSELEYNNLPFV